MAPRLHRLADGLWIYPGLPFLYIESADSLVLSDLHLGFEEAAARGLEYSLRGRSGYAGMFLPRIQLKRALEMLRAAFEVKRPSRVIVNGDLKHAFDRLLRQEREEVEALVRALRKMGIEEVLVIRGNHDNFVRGLLRRLGVKVYELLEIPGPRGTRLLVYHGHYPLDPPFPEYVVIGHEHPSVRCFAGAKLPAFLVVPLEGGGTLVVMPATGPYHPGTSVAPYRELYLSPLLRERAVLEDVTVVTWVDVSGDAEKRGFSAGEVLEVVEYDVGGRSVAVLTIRGYETLEAVCQI